MADDLDPATFEASNELAMDILELLAGGQPGAVADAANQLFAASDKHVFGGALSMLLGTLMGTLETSADAVGVTPRFMVGRIRADSQRAITERRAAGN